MTYITSSTCPEIVPRPEESSKGSFGTLAVLAGSPNMTGAARLACTGALRSGVGLLKFASDESTQNIIRLTIPEAMCIGAGSLLSCGATAILIGCGLGRGSDALLETLLTQINIPAVIDADGINFLAAHKDILKSMQCGLIVTPHPGEMSRLTGTSVSEVQSDRVGVARSFASEHGCITVLKGHGTVVACPDGEVFVNTTGGSELAKGGSGDVLAGVIASLCAQGYKMRDASLIGVYLHGKAGEILRGKYGASGTLPSDLCAEIGRLLG